MEAFKQYWEVAQDPESMGENLYYYVHQDLIQQLWQKAEQIGLWNDDGKECNVVVGAVCNHHCWLWQFEGNPYTSLYCSRT